MCMTSDAITQSSTVQYLTESLVKYKDMIEQLSHRALASKVKFSDSEAAMESKWPHRVDG